MSWTTELATYNIYYFGKRTDNVKALIYARDANNNLRVYLFFTENDIGLPSNTETISQGVPLCRIWYHIDQFPMVIDILRNEKPVWFHYESPTSAHMFTGSEPIGESEVSI
jgi:hypothetical protein